MTREKDFGDNTTNILIAFVICTLIGYAMFLMDGCFRADVHHKVKKENLLLQKELKEVKSRMCLPVMKMIPFDE